MSGRSSAPLLASALRSRSVGVARGRPMCETGGPHPTRGTTMRQWLKSNRGFLLFLVIFGFFRTAVADWTTLPSGSMRPTILEGDVVWINRLAYDLKVPLTDVIVATLGDPQRGDIVTFASPKDGTRLIKRVVGLPGDVVELRDGVLLIDGQAAEYKDLEPAAEPLGRGLVVAAIRATEVVAGSTRRV